MPCYHPLRAIRTPWSVNVSTGNPGIRILSPSEVDDYMRTSHEILTLPCGQCIGCRLQRSREWANRCMMELQYHDSAYFVTLTYDDDHVPRSFYPDPDTGEAFTSLTLHKYDLQLFHKRLRKRFSDQKIRFFACGEYGPETMRPHYHDIIFGLKLYDLIPWSKSPQGFQYYLSPSMQDLWSKNIGSNRDPVYEPFGYVLLSEVSWETCAYVARYCTKKLTGKAGEFYPSFGLEPPFSLMSTKPGIAKQYFDDHPDIYDYEYISISTPTGGRKFRPPRYFDKLFDLEQPDRMAEIKAARVRVAQAAQEFKLFNSSLSVDEILACEEANCQARIRSLQRKL